MAGVVLLAMRSGISVDTWLNGDDKSLATALRFLERENREAKRKR